MIKLTARINLDNGKNCRVYFHHKEMYELLLTIGQNVETKNIFNPNNNL
jgi:hypothetical protein